MAKALQQTTMASGRVAAFDAVAHAASDPHAERKFYDETWGVAGRGEQDGKVLFGFERPNHLLFLAQRQDAS